MATSRNVPVTALDATKIALALYITGLFISSVYYLTFSILSLDLLRAQSILIGAYFVAAFAAVPALTLLALESLKRPWTITIIFVLVLAGKDLAIAYVLELGGATTILLVVLQMAMFASFTGGWRERPLVIEYRPLTFGGPQVAALVALMLVFATRVYGQIPGYLGGGRPIPVTVLTDPQDLPANRFIQTPGTAVNTKLLSHRLSLLYEGGDQMYFVAKSSRSMEGYSIMRLRRDKVLRMDYVTPVRFKIKGNHL